ncbi:MAG: hypothetical protein KKI08_01995 [Armatimonadetes bacterium]|nr:hypothetical protein [Armatimonadota bacterium]
MAAFVFKLEFSLFPDNTLMPAGFSLGGFRLDAVDTAEPLVVNETGNAKGLQFGPSGVKVGLPAAGHQIRVTAGGFAGPVTVTAWDVSDNVIKTEQLLPTNAYVVWNLHARDISRVELTGGGNEGILLEIVAITDFGGTTDQVDAGS